MACNVAHGDGLAPARARLRLEKRSLVLDLVVVCAHGAGCELECMEACPVGAISLGASGAIVIDERTCTMCGSCGPACPYDIIWYDSVGKAHKCDLCGGEPSCARYCLLGALEHREATEADFEPVRRELRGDTGVGDP